MTTLTQKERDLYKEVWATPHYGDFAPGEHYVPIFREMAGLTDDVALSHLLVLDAGCGSGKGALQLESEGFRVIMADMTNAGLVDDARDLPFHEVCLWDDLSAQLGYLPGGKVDFAYCCDVMEHIPPQLTMLVVRRLLDITISGVFLSISLVPDHFGAWVGTSLHQTVQPFTWWKENLGAIGRVAECRDLLDTALFYVVP